LSLILYYFANNKYVFVYNIVNLNTNVGHIER
jgi:hypothetical protein